MPMSVLEGGASGIGLKRKYMQSRGRHSDEDAIGADFKTLNFLADVL
jgi:hypothetical protein